MIRFLKIDYMSRNWKILTGLSVYSIYFYTIMEWLFFFTKPSFMSPLSILDSIFIVTISPLPIAILIAILLIGLWALSIITKNTLNQNIFYTLARIIPVFVLSSSLLIMVDNFTYTIFKLGIGSFGGLKRFGYGGLFILLLIYLYRLLYRIEKGPLLQRNHNKFISGTVIMLGISVAAVFIAYASKNIDQGDVAIAMTTDIKRLPNILLIGADGLDADHMSAYGYHRNTTPFISNFMKGALVFENNFPNAGNTGGSVTSMLTGKLPTRTGVIFPPDILRGRDSYQHLPAILRKLGYTSLQLSVRHYGDAHDLNMKDSFDLANFRKVKDFRIGFLSYNFNILFESEMYFLEQIYGRVRERLLHVFGIQNMVDPFNEVTKAKKQDVPDSKRLDALFKFIDTSRGPFFAHVHLMVTHGPEFRPEKRFFSSGEKQIKPWMINFYDDAILEFDNYFNSIVEHLVKKDRFKNTVVVFYSDHGMGSKSDVRVPLMIYFPDKLHIGIVSNNTQNLDIAPTLLDYIGLEIPDWPVWMDGQSLITSDLDRLRPIISMGVTAGEVANRGDGWWEKTDLSPPFYGLREVSVIICHKVFKLDLRKKVLLTSEVTGHTSPCNNHYIPDDIEIKRYIVNHLKKNGYDISSIPIEFL